MDYKLDYFVINEVIYMYIGNEIETKGSWFVRGLQDSLIPIRPRPCRRRFLFYDAINVS